MKIAITGAAGFIGTELRKHLEGKAEVIGLVRPGESDELTDYSEEELSSLLQGVDCVIHLASKRGGGKGYCEFHENSILLENLLNAMRNAGVKKIIFMSSLAVYSDPAALPWREDSIPTPQTFYGLSKLTGEAMCRFYGKFGIHHLIFRSAIVYGGNDLTRMTGAFISGAAAHKQLKVVGKSVAKRDFIYVKEVVNALAWGALSCSSLDTTFNLGSLACHTNLELALAVNKAFQNEGNLEYLSDADENLTDSYLCSDRLTAAGYVHQYTLDTAMADIAAHWNG